MPLPTPQPSAHLSIRSSASSRYAFGFVAFVVSFVARLALTPLLGKTVPYMFFFPGIVVSAWYGGLGSGLVTTALSAIASVYFLHTQDGGFSTATIVAWAIFVCMGTLLSWLNHAFRLSERRAIEELQARKQYQEALRTSEERFTLALQAGGGIGTWDWDIPSDRVFCNPEFAALYSVNPQAANTGIPLSEFVANIHPADAAAVALHIQNAVETGGDFAQEYRLVQHDGSARWVYARARCHVDSQGNPSRFSGVAFDITDLKRAEEHLKLSNEELKRLNRELEEFAYVASHDLQEPLRMVNIYTQLLLKRLGKQDAHLTEYAGFIRQGVTRMEALIRDLLTFSQTVHEQKLPVGSADLAVALNDALSLLRSQIEESGAIISAASLPAVQGDTPQMTHVFQNLVSNALKYRKKEVRPEIHITTEFDRGQCIVRVRDNGIGFEQQYANHIFGLFKRLHKNEYPGTGLGLAICERIIGRYGGRIWAESRPGEGASFIFSLPALGSSVTATGVLDGNLS